MIPRPSLPSEPRVPSEGCEGQDFCFVGLRVTEAAGISGHTPRGPGTEAPLVKGWDLICGANLARAPHSSTVSRIISLAPSGKPTGPLGELMPVFTCFAYK